MPVVLGGDHSLAIGDYFILIFILILANLINSKGSVSGTARALGQIGLIWIDAHVSFFHNHHNFKD